MAPAGLYPASAYSSKEDLALYSFNIGLKKNKKLATGLELQTYRVVRVWKSIPLYYELDVG